MRKTLLKCICITVFILLFVGIVGIISLSAGEAKDISVQSTEPTVPKYTFTAYEGKLALFERGFAMPVEIYDVYLANLPAEEQTKIINGICAENDAEIQKIIEDYTS